MSCTIVAPIFILYHKISESQALTCKAMVKGKKKISAPFPSIPSKINELFRQSEIPRSYIILSDLSGAFQMKTLLYINRPNLIHVCSLLSFLLCYNLVEEFTNSHLSIFVLISALFVKHLLESTRLRKNFPIHSCHTTFLHCMNLIGIKIPL